MSENYSLTSKEFQDVKQKISRQSKYLDQTFVTASGQMKTLRDVSFSANHSERYYAQLLNKVHTLDSYNIDLDNKPVFLTITLDGFFRDLIKGDYRRFTPKQIKRYEGHIPNDDRNGFIWDKMLNEERLTIKECYRILSHQTTGFFKSYTFKNIRKKGLDYSYLRVTEPHKDGVPHFHILVYLPEHLIPNLHKAFKGYFPASQNHKPLSVKRNGRLSGFLASGERETQGFQFEIKKATGYILKYILKSFRNVKNNEEIDYLQAWYIHYRIPRIISSHTIIPAWVYQKLALLDEDWHYHNATYKNNIAVWNQKKYDEEGVMIQKATFRFDDGFGRVFEYDNGVFTLTNKGYLIHKFGVEESPKINKRFKVVPNEDLQKDYVRTPLIPVVFEDTQETLFITKNDYVPKWAVFYKSVSKMSGFDLWQIYEDFDFDMLNPALFGNIKNELIKRGLLDEMSQSLNDYNVKYYDDWSDYDGLYSGY